MTLGWATSAANNEAIGELKALGPPPYHDFSQQIMISKWASSAYGGIDAHLSEAKLLSREPFTSIQPEFQDVQMRVSTAMYSELGRLNMEPQLPNQKTRLLVIVGRLDAVVPPSGMRSGYDMYGGPKKWIELGASHHLQFVDEAETFVKAIVSFVR
jgi:pimeloyl-ACP methyl ester carboxylesterase